MKIKKQIESIEGVELVEKADKGVLVVYLKEKVKKPSNEELFAFALANYPVGTKFIDMEDGAIRTVASDDFMVMQHEVNVPTPESEWDGVNSSDPFLFLNGKWAKIVKPLFKTEDGVDIYDGDRYWLIDKNWTILSLFACQNTYTKITLFSSKEKAQEYIDSHKPLTLVEGEIYTVREDGWGCTFRHKSVMEKSNEELRAMYYSLSNAPAYLQNKWLVYQMEGRTCTPSSVQEKKAHVTAEVNNGYFHRPL